MLVRRSNWTLDKPLVIQLNKSFKSTTVNIHTSSGHGSSYMDMKKFMGMEEEKHGRVSRTDTMTDDAAFTELVAQFKRGSITEAEFAQIVDNNEEELEENDMQPENEDDIDMEFNIQVTCEECATLNNTCRGPKCRLCRADLVVAPIHFL